MSAGTRACSASAQQGAGEDALLRTVRDPQGPVPAVSAVVPVLDAGPRLLTLLDALFTQDVAPVEVIVVDSGSADGAVEQALRRWSALRVYAVDGHRFNHGLVRSAAVGLARAELVALFSQDAVPLGAGCLRALMEALQDPAVAGVMARQLPRPGADPGVIGTLRRWTPPGHATEVRWATAWSTPAERMRAARFDNVGSMVRRSVLQGLPFPARPFGEDLAWGDAALAAGHALAYEPSALVEHHHDAGLRQTYRRHRASHQQAAREFGLRALPRLSALPGAYLAGVPTDLEDGGLPWVLRGAPRRVAALLGQWAGGSAGVRTSHLSAGVRTIHLTYSSICQVANPDPVSTSPICQVASPDPVSDPVSVSADDPFSDASPASGNASGGRSR